MEKERSWNKRCVQDGNEDMLSGGLPCGDTSHDTNVVGTLGGQWRDHGRAW